MYYHRIIDILNNIVTAKLITYNVFAYELSTSSPLPSYSCSYISPPSISPNAQIILVGSVKLISKFLSC